MPDYEWLGRIAKSVGEASLSSAVALPYTLGVVSLVTFMGTVALTTNPIAVATAAILAVCGVGHALVAWHRCFQRDPRLLRSERYNLRMTELEMLGDSESGTTTTVRTQIELRPIESTSALEKKAEARE